MGWKRNRSANADEHPVCPLCRMRMPVGADGRCRLGHVVAVVQATPAQDAPTGPEPSTGSSPGSAAPAAGPQPAAGELDTPSIAAQSVPAEQQADHPAALVQAETEAPARAHDDPLAWADSLFGAPLATSPSATEIPSLATTTPPSPSPVEAPASAVQAPAKPRLVLPPPPLPVDDARFAPWDEPPGDTSALDFDPAAFKKPEPAAPRPVEPLHEIVEPEGELVAARAQQVRTGLFVGGGVTLAFAAATVLAFGGALPV